MRVRRHGSTERRSTLKPGVIEHTGGYLLEHRPGHPLSRLSKRVYQHRAVFHQHHGEGPFKCHWCGIQVTWETMHVDHLNDVVTDNDIGNLAASCARCNQARGLPKMRLTMKRAGRLITAHGMTMCVSDWARHLGLARWTLMGRLAKGMPPDEAMTADRAATGPARRRRPMPDHVVDLAAA